SGTARLPRAVPRRDQRRRADGRGGDLECREETGPSESSPFGSAAGWALRNDSLAAGKRLQERQSGECHWGETAADGDSPWRQKDRRAAPGIWGEGRDLNKADGIRNRQVPRCA